MSRIWQDPHQSRDDQSFRPILTNRQSNIFRPSQQQLQYRSFNSYEQPINRLQHLNNLCNDLIKAHENYGSPIKYANFVVLSILDNTDVDLCNLLPRYDKEHEELTHRLGCLIGVDSPTFKLIFSDESLFEYFLNNFTRHAELSNATFGTASNSLYNWLLCGYLQRILPLSDTSWASVQMSTRYKPQNSKQQTRKALKTPFQLLRKDFFANLTDSSFDETFEFDHSTYARLFQFFELLLSSYTNSSVPPSPAQVVSLRTLVEIYTEFLLTPTNDKELETFKARLRSNRQFSHLMLGYLRPMLSNNALNEAFVYYFDISITLLCPTESTFLNFEALSLFKRVSTVHYLELLDILVDRLSTADIGVIMRLDLLQYFLVVLMNSNFIRLLCDLKISAIKYLKPIQRRLNAIADVNPNASSFSRLTSFMTDILEQSEEKNVKTYLAIINDRLKSPYATYPPSDPSERPAEEDSFVDLTNVTAGVMNSTLNRKPRIGVPDHYVDSWNSMYYLTPKGIEQVLNRQARFNFNQYGKKIYEAQGKCRWENKFLAEKLTKIALSWAHHPFVRNLRRISNNQVLGPAVRPFMIPKSPPKDVPVYGKQIPRHPETINLRILASYPVLILLTYLLWSFFAYLLSFVF